MLVIFFKAKQVLHLSIWERNINLQFVRSQQPQLFFYNQKAVSLMAFMMMIMNFLSFPYQLRLKLVNLNNSKSL